MNFYDIVNKKVTLKDYPKTFIKAGINPDFVVVVGNNIKDTSIIKVMMLENPRSEWVKVSDVIGLVSS